MSTADCSLAVDDFLTIIDSASDSLHAQLGFIQGCLRLHPAAPDGFLGIAERSVLKFAVHIDRLREDLWTASVDDPLSPVPTRANSWSDVRGLRRQEVELELEEECERAAAVAEHRLSSRGVNGQNRVNGEFSASAVGALQRLPLANIVDSHRKMVSIVEEAADVDDSFTVQEEDLQPRRAVPLPDGGLAPGIRLRSPRSPAGDEDAFEDDDGDFMRKIVTVNSHTSEEENHLSVMSSGRSRESKSMSERSENEDKLFDSELMSMQNRTSSMVRRKSTGSVVSANTMRLRMNEWESAQDVEGDDDFSGLNDEDTTSICIGGVLNPNLPARLGWDFLVILIVIVDALVLPYQIAYASGGPPSPFDSVWLVLSTTFFCVDIIASFVTGYPAGKREIHIYEPGKLVTKYKLIWINYARTWLPIDFVSTIPWSLLAELGPSEDEASKGGAQVAKLTKVVKFVRFLRLIRMLRLAKLATIWERIEGKLGSITILHVVALFRVFMVIISVCHWNACLWWLIGREDSLVSDLFTEDMLKSWQSIDHWTSVERPRTGGGTWRWIDKGPAEQYLFSFYWTLGVMRTMPSEVWPENIVERVYVLVFMILALVVFAITVTQITQAFMKIYERRRLFNEDMAYVRLQMRNWQAPDNLQMKIKSYLIHLFDRRRMQAKEEALFNRLPEPLSKMLRLSSLQTYVSRMDMASTMTKKALTVICSLAEVCDKLPNEVISTRGEVADACYVLVVGRLEVIDGELMDEVINGELMAGRKEIKVVDEVALLTPERVESERTVKAVLTSEVLRIEKRRFIRAFLHHPSFSKKLGKNRRSLQNLNELAAAEEDAQRARQQNVTDMNQRLHSYQTCMTAAVVSSS